VNIKFSGWVEELYVDETGQRVKEGQPMLSIYSPDLVSTQEEYLLAYRNAQKLANSSFMDVSGGSRSLLESSRRRLLYWDISEKQIRELEESGKVRKTVTLYAPSTGVVIKKMVERGARVVPGMDIYQLADLSTLWVYGQIYQYEVPYVRVGQPVQVNVSYIPGRTYDGKVDYVYPFLDEKTRNVNVRIVVPNPHLELKPQMYATVDFSSSIGTHVTAIPSDAVIRTGTRNVVFVAQGGGKFEPRDVVLGPEGQDNLVQVIAGVLPGERVVTSAQFMIDSESRLKEAIQKMLEAKKQSALQPTPDGGHGSGSGDRMEGGGSATGQAAEDEGAEMKEMPHGDGEHQKMKDSGSHGPEGDGGTEPSAMNKGTKSKVIDPVCKMSITPDERLSHTFNGKTYYFCCVADLEAFRDNPQAFIAD